MTTPRSPKPPTIFRQYFRLLRFYLVTGLLVWFPLIVTVWLTYWLFKNVGLGLENITRNAFTWLVREGGKYQILSFLRPLEGDYPPGTGFLIAIALFLATGFLTRYFVGRQIIFFGERLLDRIPMISKVYRAVQQIRDVFVNREGTVFQSVCLVEYPRKGVFAVAFVTQTEQGIVQQTAGKDLVAVFLPTTPNPTSGFLLYLPAKEVVHLDFSVEEAMKLIVSGGAYLPAKHRPALADHDAKASS